MVLELAKSAIYIKMAAKAECPIISAFEYCFAAGLAFHKMGLPEETKNEIRDLTDFTEVKERVGALVTDSNVFETFEHGDRLRNMLKECRIKGDMDAQTRELFDMGYSES